MKQLLLLLLLLPVALFGQTSRRAVADSIRSATVATLHHVSRSFGNHPRTQVEQVTVADSGDYIIVEARVHVGYADTVRAMAVMAAEVIKAGAIAAENMGIVSVPDLPPVALEKDTVAALAPMAFVAIQTGAAIATVRMGMVIVPATAPYALEKDMVAAAATLRVVAIKADAVAEGSMDVTLVPELPPYALEKDSVAALAAVAANQLNTDIVFVPMGTFGVPPLPAVLPEPSEGLPLAAVVAMVAVSIPTAAMDTLAALSFEDKKFPVEGMHLSDDGYSLLEKLEGFSPELYSLRDGGFTIGFGFFVPYGEGAKWEKGVTWEEAERMIRQKVPQYEDQVKRYINVPLTQKGFDALTMLAYNLGGFSKATSVVNDVNSQADFHKLQSDWSRFVHSKAPGVAKGLMNRRKDEIGVRKESDYQPERKIQILTFKR